jgi:hypothetical protein
VRLTEEQYLSLTNPTPTVNLFNCRTSPVRTSTRKARLFCCAVCRRVWDWLGPDANRAAVEAAERAADGLIRVKDLRPFFKVTRNVRAPLQEAPKAQANPAWAAAFPTTWPPASLACEFALWLAGSRGAGRDVSRQTERMVAESAAQCALLRDLLGNPFRRPAATPLSRQPAPNGNAVKLAKAIYDGRSFADLPVLADALEDEGVTDADVLDHLRGGGEHARGCWALDLVLGMK